MSVKSFLPAISWLILSMILLAIPGKDLPHSKFFEIPFFDKYVHFFMFLILTVLFCYPFFYLPAKTAVIKAWFLKIASYAVVYGILMEYVQRFFVQDRSFDVADMAVDALGSLVGLLIAVQAYSKKIGPNRHRGRNQN